jgi:hypothetical protein
MQGKVKIEKGGWEEDDKNQVNVLSMVFVVFEMN